ncbi:MAG TPA: tyrosine--tRNA ligase [Candidatus Saccharimonadales bacterium]|nr:tyrosine--tRNA ligase [Candidatus Saccharimonadales bacterium]
MTLSEELQWRGFVNQTTYKDIQVLDGAPIAFYWGVDPSANSMTVGNLAIAMMVRHFIAHGHKAVLLVGGATGLIGDPDGKAQERDLKPVDEVDRNAQAIIGQYQQLFAGQTFEVVNNYDWFKGLGYLEFLRTVGKHVPMRQMLGREFVQKRLSEDGAGISYAEFSYSLIQGYDFLHLFRTKGVHLQVCGADQWGNSIAGVELIRRIEGGEADIWSAPLVVNKATGVKFGKSEGGAVWLDEQQTSVYRFYQFWLNADDESVESYLGIYTLLTRDQVAGLMTEFKQSPGGRAAQKALAYEVTKVVHGADKADAARKVTEVLFGDRPFMDLVAADLTMLKAELPSIQSSADETLPALLVRAGLAGSRSEAGRLINAGAIVVNGKKLTGVDIEPLQPGDNLIRRGKNSFAVVTR